MEAAADVIAHAAERHRAKRVQRHVARAASLPVRACSRSRNSSSLGRGKLRRAAKPAAPRVEGLRELLRRVAIERARGWHRPAPAAAPFSRAQAIDQVSRPTRRYSARSVAPGARDLAQHVDEPGTAPPRRRREVRAAVERLQLRRQPHAHRPAARPRRRLHERHVDAIDVGPLFAIDLDRDEVAVEDRRDRRRSRTTRAP